MAIIFEKVAIPRVEAKIAELENHITSTKKGFKNKLSVFFFSR